MPDAIATSYMDIVTFVINLLLSVHIFSTWWLWVGDSALEPDERDEEAWLSRQMDEIYRLKDDEFYTYQYACNYVVAVFTGGAVFVAPRKLSELVFTSGVNVVQFIFAATLTALFTNLYETIASSRRDFQDRDIVLQEFFFVHRVPKDLKERVTRFLYHKFGERSFMAANEMVKELPEALRHEVLVSVRAGYLQRGHSFFRGLSIDALNFICTNSVDTFFMDNDTMITAGTPADCAYFMMQGVVVVLLTDNKEAVMKAPCSLGEASLFSTTHRRSATVVAIKPSAAISVSRQVVEECISLYPTNQEYYRVFCDLMATRTPSGGGEFGSQMRLESSKSLSSGTESTRSDLSTRRPLRAWDFSDVGTAREM
jgi:CRP-like cAMP-binding protein